MTCLAAEFTSGVPPCNNGQLRMRACSQPTFNSFPLVKANMVRNSRVEVYSRTL